jgi:phosphoenolpyruvate synthase/pyruvate phosphate dikinase
MLGFRGASATSAHSFRDCFELECRAMKKVRNELGLTNVEIMVPFVRNLDEAAGVVDLLGRARPQARQERPQAHHDVRDPVQRAAGRAVPASTSTASPSAPTT